MRTSALLILALLTAAPATAATQDVPDTTDTTGTDPTGTEPTEAPPTEPVATFTEAPPADGVKPEEVEIVGSNSTAASQDRTFPGTRFWKLDKGKMQVEFWWRRRELERKETDAKWGDGFNILQMEFEVGLTDRVQLDIYQNFWNRDKGEGNTGWRPEGTQIEARIAYDPVYNRTPLNPVLYLEWHPLHQGPVRAEGRILLGQEVLSQKLLAAFNLFYEQNVTEFLGEYEPNPELGFTAGGSYAVSGQKLRLGGEVKVAFEKDNWDDDRWSKQVLVGPNIATRLSGEKLRLYATGLFGVTDDARRFDGFLILASML